MVAPHSLLRHGARMQQFVLVPVLSMLSILVVLPLISRLTGPSGWVALGVGQGIGAFASVIVGLAWPIIGAHEVASLEVSQRGVLARTSLKTRLLVFLLVMPPVVMVTGLLVDTHRVEGMLFAIGTMLNGFTFAWFYAGTGNPAALLRNEALPRLLANVAAIPALMWSGQLVWYAVLLLLSGLLTLVLNSRTVLSGGTRRLPWRAEVRQTIGHLRNQQAMTAARTTVLAVTYLSPAIVSAVAPGILAPYSALDRVSKSAQNAVGVIPNGLAAWVSSGSRDSLARRIRLVFWFTVILMLALAGGWELVADAVVGFIFGGEVTLTPAASVLVGLAIAVYFGNASFSRLIAVPLGMTRFVTVVSVVGAVATVAGVICGATAGSLSGTLAGALVGDALAVGSYAVASVRRVGLWGEGGT